MAAGLPRARITRIPKLRPHPAERVPGAVRRACCARSWRSEPPPATEAGRRRPPDRRRRTPPRADARRRPTGTRTGPMIHGDILGERARLTPDKTALVLVDSGERLTYRQLDERAVRCARMWRETLGLRQGRPGRHPGPQPGRVRRGVLRRRQDRHRSRHPRHPADRARAASTSSPTRACGRCSTTAPSPRRSPRCAAWSRWSTGSPSTSRSRRRTGATASSPPALAEAGFERQRCDPEDTYCLLYTSGTTGAPKGVVIPHRQVSWNGYNTVASWQLQEDDVSPIFTPLYHAGGLMAFPDAAVHHRRHHRAARRLRRLRDLAHHRDASAAPWSSACRRSGRC